MSSVTESIGAIEIFLSFTHEDMGLRNELEKHLNILKRQGQITSWYNREIHANGEWAHEVDAHINEAQIILLLVSPDFMNSDYCYGPEMARALERHKAGEARVIPIIIRPVYWEDAPFSRLPVLPVDKEPVTKWPNLDEAFLGIARNISNVVKELLASNKIADAASQHKNMQYMEALETYEQALQLDPDNALAYSGKGNILYDLKQYKEALEAYKRSARLDLDNALTYYNMGATLYYLKHYEQALEAYELALRLDPSDTLAYHSKGNALRRLKRNREALEAYEQALRLDPDNALAYNGKGNVLYDLKRYEEALEAYEHVIQLDPNNALTYYNIGNASHNLKRYISALVAYEQAIQLASHYAPAYYHKGETLRSLWRYNQALTAYDQAIRLDPDYAAAYYARGTTLYLLKRYEQALTAYDQAIRLDPDYAAAYYGKGETLYRLKRYGLARAIAEQAICFSPDYAAAYNLKGNAHSQLHHYKAALEAYEKAIQLDPHLASAYIGKSNMLYNLKRYEEASPAYEKAIIRNPKNISAYIGRGNTLYHLQQYAEAALIYDQAIQLDPGNVSAHIGAGGAFRNLRRYERALEAYEEAILLDPNNALAHDGKGKTLYDLKRYEEAFEAYEWATLLDPRNVSTYLNKGNALYDLKRYEMALASYEQASRLAPNEAIAHYKMGLSLENLKRHEEALIAYKQAMRLDSTMEPVWPQSLLVRIKTVQEFLVKAGFDFSDRFDPFALGFLAVANASMWRERFPTGVYVRILFDQALDQSTVRAIQLEARALSNYVLVLIDQQPAMSGWAAIFGLRLEDKERFFFLPIAESLMKDGIASKNERQTLSIYINKQLGKDFDPYDDRYPVFDAVSFFGRESLTDEIINALKLRQSLGLFGLHKMGKSSVLKRLQKKAEFPTAYVYLSKGDSLEGIYKRILESWSADIRIKYPSLKWPIPEITAKSDLKMAFDSATKYLLTLLNDVTNAPLLAVFLDEIEHIVPYQIGDVNTLQLYISLMDSLRGLQQETNNLSLLIAGVHPNAARRNYFWSDQKNPLHQVISERFLLPLDKEDCNYMVRSLGQQINLTYDDDALEYIIRMSGAHPFLARQLCSLVFKNRGSADTISIQTIQKTARDFVNNPATASYFDDDALWGELGKQDIWGEDISYAIHQILDSLAASPIDLAESEICRSLDRRIVERALAALSERGIISALNGAGHYQITFGLFRDWIRLHKLGME